MDKKGLLFHIDSDDYFITLATVLNFFVDELEKMHRSQELKEGGIVYLKRCLEEARDELLFLQKNFSITRRPLKWSTL